MLLCVKKKKSDDSHEASSQQQLRKRSRDDRSMINRKIRPPVNTASLQKKEEQIVGTWEKSQWIDTQRSLSHLQYPDATKSSAKDLSLPQVNL